jgi:poly(ADP-ribose) glycohydrolase ARH3
MRRALEAVRLGERDVAFSVWPEGSKGNGGAVRVVPVACRYHDESARLTTFADEATRVTHAHELGRAGAIVHALAIAALVGRADTTLAPSVVLAAVRSPVEAPLGDKLAHVAALLDRGVETAEAARVLGNGVLAEEAVPLALFVFLRHGPGYLDVVRQAILAGGDTDTVAAMAGALAGAATGYAALPPELLARLENGPRGRDHTLGLADATFAAWEAGDLGDRQPA